MIIRSDGSVTINDESFRLDDSLGSVAEILSVPVRDGQARVAEATSAGDLIWIISEAKSTLCLLGCIVMEGDASWGTWSSNNEQERKKIHDQLLVEWDVRTGSTKGCYVFSDYDPRSGASVIMVRKG